MGKIHDIIEVKKARRHKPCVPLFAVGTQLLRKNSRQYFLPFTGVQRSPPLQNLVFDVLSFSTV